MHHRSARARRALGRSSLMLLLLLPLPAAAGAQQALALRGLELRIGAAGPEEADPGFSMGADVALGSVLLDRLQLIAGGHYFMADVDRSVAGTPVTGSLSVLGGRLGLRLDLVEAARLTPYGLAHVGLFSANTNDVTVEETRELIEGMYVGAGVGAGLAYAFGATRRTSAVVEARRVLANNVDHWAVEVGLRFTRRTDEELARARARVDADRRRIERERRLADSTAVRRPPPRD